MAAERIHILLSEHGWIVLEEGGREVGSYATREAAEAVGRPLARMHNADLLIHSPSGKIERRIRSFRGWLRKLLGGL